MYYIKPEPFVPRNLRLEVGEDHLTHWRLLALQRIGDQALLDKLPL